MRIKQLRTQNLLTYVLVTVLIIVIGLASTSFYLNNKRREGFLKSNISQIEKSIIVAISFESNRLKQIAFDYTFWDEMVNFSYKPKANWAQDNLDPIITTYHTDLVCVLDSNLNKVYTINREEYPFLRNLRLSDSTLRKIVRDRFIQFHYLTDSGIVEIHGATIHMSNDQSRIGNPYGIFIVGKVIDSTYLKNVSLVTGSRIWLDSVPVDKRLIQSKEGIFLSIPLIGQDDMIIGYYNVEKDYDYFKHYTNFSLQLISILIISSIFIVVTLIIILYYWVNRPLKIVEQVLYDDNTSKIPHLKRFGREFEEIGNLMSHVITQKKNLEVLKEKAEESDRLKSAFLANMSHEIRTPLNAISGFAELLCQNFPEDEESKSYKKIIMNSSNDLLHLINDILDYSKIEVGQLVLNKEVFSLNELFIELYSQYSKKNSNKAVKILYSSPNEYLNLNSDRQRIKQIMVNLLDNALKFTEKGYVEFGFRVDGPECVLWVKDSGVGIPENARDLIFERFHQVNKNPTKFYGGTGLGLTICRGLAELLGGKVLYSPNVEDGSIFSVALPYSNLRVTDKKVLDDQSFSFPKWQGKKILVVEDDVLSAKLITQYLKNTGVEITSFNEADAALRYLETNDVDIVLMDIRIMGDMDGFAATSAIKAIYPNIPVIAQTAFALDLDRRKAIKSGCDEYISKPYNSETLIKAMAKFI